MKTVSFLEAGVARRRIPRFVRRFQPRYELPAFAVLRPGNPAAVPTGGVSQSSPFSPPQRGEDAEAMRGSLLAEPGPAAARRFCAHTKTRRAKFSVLPQGVLRRPAPLHPTPPPPGLRRLRMTVEPELSGSGSVSGSCDSATLRLCDFATLRLCDFATLRLPNDENRASTPTARNSRAWTPSAILLRPMTRTTGRQTQTTGTSIAPCR
jgi:hypothetical protein